MLSNKYVVFAVFALLILVAAFNIKFFSSKKASQTDAEKTVSKPISEVPHNKVIIPERVITNRDSSKWNRDPFSIAMPDERIEIIVSGIIKRDGQSHALINGGVYSINDAIGSSVIMDIKRESVVISTKGIMSEIFLSDNSAIKETKNE